MLIARRVATLLVISVMGATLFTGLWLWFDGYRAYVVHTGSMSPHYKPGTLVIDQPASSSYGPGSVITFRHSSRSTDVVTHRITDIASNGLIHTKGDGNATPDVWNIRPDQVRGVVIAGVPLAGYMVVFLQQPAGIAAVMLVVVAMFLLWGLFFTPSPDNDEEPSSQQIGGQARRRFRLPGTSRRGMPTLSGLVIVTLLLINLTVGAAVLVHHSSPAEIQQTAPAIR